MSNWTRRGFLVASSATVAACATTSINGSRDELDRNVDTTVSEMYRSVPGSQQLAERASGMLIIPNVTKAGLMFGGAYGEGVLLIGQAKVDYFNLASASFGPQIGVQSFHHALFFMTQEALAGFRFSDGWQLGVDASFTTPEDAISFGVTTNTINVPVYALNFGQQGLIVGATMEGAKYSRMVR